jgi:hypothetical protein
MPWQKWSISIYPALQEKHDHPVNKKSDALRRFFCPKRYRLLSSEFTYFPYLNRHAFDLIWDAILGRKHEFR